MSPHFTGPIPLLWLSFFHQNCRTAQRGKAASSERAASPMYPRPFAVLSRIALGLSYWGAVVALELRRNVLEWLLLLLLLACCFTVVDAFGGGSSGRPVAGGDGGKAANTCCACCYKLQGHLAFITHGTSHCHRLLMPTTTTPQMCGPVASLFSVLVLLP